MELKGYKKRVLKILEKWESARNYDGQLFAHYINEYHPEYVFEKSIALKDFAKLPSFENIRRSRQIIQNTLGLCLPTDPIVIKKRKIKQRNYTECEVREACI